MKIVKPFVMNAGVWSAYQKSKTGTAHSVWEEMNAHGVKIHKQSIYNLSISTSSRSRAAVKIAEFYGIPIEEFDKLVRVRQVVEPY